MRKFYLKLKEFTYADILIINFITIIVSMVVWIMYLLNTDLLLNMTAEMIVKDIKMCLLIHLLVWLSSSAINSIILYTIKRKKKK